MDGFMARGTDPLVRRDMRRVLWLITAMCGLGACASRARSSPTASHAREAPHAPVVPAIDSGQHVTVLPDGRLRIRGQTGPTTGNPVFVIDGVVYEPSSVAGDRIVYQSPLNGRGERSPLPNVAPDDIEEIEVLKGATAIERFGPRARDGAIVIRTRRPPAPEQRGASVSSPT